MIEKIFIETAKRAFFFGLQSSTGGNISIRINQNIFITKPSGLSLFSLKKNDLITMDLEGKIIKGSSKPTKEVKFHIGIFKIRNDVNAVVHYHPPWATAFACKGIKIPLITLHSKRILQDVPLIPLKEEGSSDLAYLITNVFKNQNVKAITLTGHGLVAVGSTIYDAQNIAELVEETAKIAWISNLIQ